MKKVILTIGVLAAVMVACKKKTTENPVPGIGTATIKGMIKEQTGKDAKTNVLYGPATGVVVTAVVSTKDLVVNPSSSAYAEKVYTATTDANGMYSITLDANQKVVNVTLKAQDYYKDYTDKRDTTITTDGKEVNSVYDIPYKNLVFKASTTVNSATQTINMGETKLVDFLFTPNRETIKMVK